MDNQMDDKKRFNTAFAIAFLFHICLGALFLAITINMSPLVPEFVEMAFVKYISPGSSGQNLSQTQSGGVQRSGQETRIVDLPKRSFLETEKEQIPLETRGKLQTEETVKGTVTRVDPLKTVGKDTTEASKISVTEERKQAGAQKIETGEKVAVAPPTEGAAGTAQLGKPFEIMWEGGTREILVSPLPKFPESVKKEVVLKFRIQVIPDGTVREIIPLQKGEATLETITTQALKQWLFNPLEKSAPQVSQYGVITFRFVLK